MWIRAGQFFAGDIVCPGLGSDWQAEYHKIAVDKSQNAGIYISTYLRNTKPDDKVDRWIR